MLEIVLSLLWTLLVTGGILALAYWFTRHVVGRVAPRSLVRQRHLTVLEQVPLGRDQRLMLVQIGKRVYILATSSGGITNLGELPEEEAAQLMQPEGEHQETPEGFAQTLRRVLDQRKRGGGGDGRTD